MNFDLAHAVHLGDAACLQEGHAFRLAPARRGVVVPENEFASGYVALKLAFCVVPSTNLSTSWRHVPEAHPELGVFQM